MLDEKLISFWVLGESEKLILFFGESEKLILFFGDSEKLILFFGERKIAKQRKCQTMQQLMTLARK